MGVARPDAVRGGSLCCLGYCNATRVPRVSEKLSPNAQIGIDFLEGAGYLTRSQDLQGSVRWPVSGRAGGSGARPGHLVRGKGSPMGKIPLHGLAGLCLGLFVGGCACCGGGSQKTDKSMASNRFRHGASSQVAQTQQQPSRLGTVAGTGMPRSGYHASTLPSQQTSNQVIPVSGDRYGPAPMTREQPAPVANSRVISTSTPVQAGTQRPSNITQPSMDRPTVGHQAAPKIDPPMPTQEIRPVTHQGMKEPVQVPVPSMDPPAPNPVPPAPPVVPAPPTAGETRKMPPPAPPLKIDNIPADPPMPAPAPAPIAPPALPSAELPAPTSVPTPVPPPPPVGGPDLAPPPPPGQ